MASYRRVLQAFDRSVKQKSVECDYDIHPWDILINGARWDGKIRLIGFVDVFFLICYSGTSRFEKGIVIYKAEDDDAIRAIMRNTQVTAEQLGLEVVNQDEVKEAKNRGRDIPEKYFDLKRLKGGLDYTVTSLGHEVGVRTEYEKTVLRKYVIKVRKGRDVAMKSNQHNLFDLMHDAVRLGFITQAELIGTVIGKTVGGSMIDDMFSKYADALTGAKNSKNLALAGDKS
ncbi:hypothetical protein DL768_010754 [Monosporascus sp. mg162]|nr:hypothetical protein DL768_010754 [Monosporascus sp. mg162]